MVSKFLPLTSVTWPYLFLLVLAFGCMLLSALRSTRSLQINGWIAGLGLSVAAGGFARLFSLYSSKIDPGLIIPIQSGEMVFDAFGYFLAVLVCLIALVVVIISYRYLQRQEIIPEFFSLLVFSTLGMTLMVATTHLITFVLGLEVMSLALYVLVAIKRQHLASSEASFKYFLLGSVATAFLLLGISFFYGASGTLDLAQFSMGRVSPDFALILKAGVLLIVLGFAFKIAAVPFHFWAPDVYDGSSYPVVGYMATGVKVAAIGALLRFVQILFQAAPEMLSSLFLFFSIATMLVGNLAALRQKSLKRILAYSSIAHAGYLLLGLNAFLCGKDALNLGASSILFYLVAYSLLTLGAFAILSTLSNTEEDLSTLDHLNGLATHYPKRAAGLSIFLISLAGIPPTVGFFAKYYLFAEAVHVGLYPLAIVGVLSSAISLYYYLGPVVRMYFYAGDKALNAAPIGLGLRLLLAVLVVGVFYLGLFPNQMIHLTKLANISSHALLSAHR